MTRNSNPLTRWVIAITICLSGWGADSWAQTNLPERISGSLKPVEPDSNSIDQLRQSEPGTMTRARIRRTSFQSMPQESLTDQSRSDGLNRSRVDLIQKQILQLQKWINEDRAADAIQEAEQQQVPLTTVPTIPPIETTPASEQSPDEDPDSIDPPTVTEDAASQPPPMAGTPVVAQPINPFKLASSLFLTGNIEASRKSYEAGLADASPEEKLWIQCFIGCCYRLEGDFTQAEATFRDVTNDRSASFPVDYAKWCLKYLDQRRNSLEQFRQIEADIDSIVKGLEKNEGT